MSRFRPDGEGWERLDIRNLAVSGAKVLKEGAVPAAAGLIALISSGNLRWVLLGAPFVLIAAAVLGLLPWLSTYFRVTTERLELSSGVLSRNKRSAPLDRVRSVDLTATLVHRLIGLRKVEIGTGVDGEQFVLDALPTARAEQLRANLLGRRTTAPAAAIAQPGMSQAAMAQPAGSAEAGGLGAASAYGAGDQVTTTVVEEPAEVLATFTWSWARFAPFSLTRLVVLAAILGFASQFLDDLPIFDPEHLRDAWEWVTSFALALVVVVLLVGGLALWVLIAVFEYVTRWWDLRLERQHGNLNLSAGLFSTRSTSIEERRIRGLQHDEPLLMRVVRGAQLSVMATGLSDNSPTILPPAPRRVTRAVGGELINDPDALTVPLARHGAKALRRTLIAHQGLTEFAVIGALIYWLAPLPDEVYDVLPAWSPWAWIGVSVLLGLLTGALSYRHLGHALTERHLVVGSGMFTRRREVLEHDGVIGWVFEQAYFQRLGGLTDLVATTAAGSESVRLRNVALVRAVELARTSTPHAVDGFREGAPPARDERGIHLAARSRTTGT